MQNKFSYSSSDELSRPKKFIVNSIEKQTLELLKTNKKYIEDLAEDLLKNETINYNKIKSLIPEELENSQEIKLPEAGPKEEAD